MRPEIPRIDDVGFEELLAEAKARIAVHTPDWTNHNESDPGITILELFSFLTESLLYRANRIPERNRRRFLHLLGIGTQEATPASGLVTFDATKGPARATVVPAEQEVRAGALPFRTERAVDVLPLEAIACYKSESEAGFDAVTEAHYLEQYADLAPGASGVTYYETRRLEVPSGASTYRPVRLGDTVDESLWLALLAPRADLVDAVRDEIAHKVLSVGILPQVVDAARTLLPQSTRRAEDPPQLTYAIPVGGSLAAQPSRLPSYRRLDAVEQDNVLVEPGTVEIALPGAGELVVWDDLEPAEEGFGDFPPMLEDDERERVVTWVRIRRPGEAADGTVGELQATRLAASFSWVGVNAVTVRQLGRVRDERLPDGTGQPDQHAQLANRPVLTESVELTVDHDRWTRTQDLRTAPPEVTVGRGADPAGRAEVSGPPTVFSIDAASGTVAFGSGLRGARPRRGAVIRAAYAFGGGSAGLVPVGALSTGPGLPSGVTVTNPVPTWGGADGESVEDAEARLAKVVHHRERLVTRSDMVEITARVPGVDLGRAEILPLLHPDLVGVESPGVVTVLVIPRTDPGQPAAPRPDRMFIDTVCAYLDRRRLVTTEVHVRGPTYVGIRVSVGFEAGPGRDVPPVREAVAAAVRTFLSPLPRGARGAWQLGKAVDAREILTEAARVDGVAAILGVRLSAASGGETDRVPLEGLELPHLVGLAVQPGDPPSLDGLVGKSEPSAPATLPVPVIPEEC